MFGRKSRGDATLIMTISSTGASFAIVSDADPAKPLLETRVELPLEKRSISQALATLKQVTIEKGESLIKTYSEKNGRSIARAYVVLEAPLVESFSVQASKAFQNPTKVTDSLLDS